jgi:Domain of unknown function (DUF4258)
MIVTTHGARRLLDRGISIDEVERIVRTGQPSGPGDNGNLVFEGYGDGGIRTAVVTDSSRSRLITAYRIG